MTICNAATGPDQRDSLVPPLLPRHPRLVGDPTIVWRAAQELQVGLDDDAIVLSSVPRAAEAVIRRLTGRHDVHDLTELLPRPWIEWLLANLQAHGRLADGPATSDQISVRVMGTGLVAAQLAAGLLDMDVNVRLADPLNGSSRALQHLARLLSRGRRPAQQPVLEPNVDLRSGGLTLSIVATDAAEPDRMLTDMLVQYRLPHLVLRIHPGRALVGPLVIPGRTACVRCLDLLRTASDPAWPIVACELSRISIPPHQAPTRWAVALAVAHVLALATGGLPDSLGGTLELGSDGITRFRRSARHPACHCRAAELADSGARMVA